MRTRLKFAIAAFAAVATVAALAAGALGVYLAYDSQSSRVESLERAYLEQSSQVAQLERENRRIVADREALSTALAASSKHLADVVRLVRDEATRRASVLGATAEKAASRPKTAASGARLVLTAGRGPSWLEVHVADRAGRRLYRDTLARGRSLRFSAKALWLRIGRPPSLEATLNGKALSLPPRTATIVVTAQGIRVLKLAGGRG
jgi:hypothetical protein